MKKQKVSMRSQLFGDMVEEIDQKITEAFDGMRTKEIEESTVTVKISLALTDQVAEEEGKIRVLRVPVISYKLQSAMKYVSTSAGIMNTGGVELEQAEDGTYILAPAPGSQVSMEDAMEEAEEDDEFLERLEREYAVEQGALGENLE